MINKCLVSCSKNLRLTVFFWISGSPNNKSHMCSKIVIPLEDEEKWSCNFGWRKGKTSG